MRLRRMIPGTDSSLTGGSASPVDIGHSADDYGDSDGEWLEIDWHRHLNRITVETAGGDTEVSYVSIGEGPPLLFVHGLGGSWRNWLENLPHFARNNRAIALDLPGFGYSPMPPWQIDIATYGEFITRFADRLELGPGLPLIGHSMGGFIATEAVIAAPQRYSKLVLVSAAGVSFASRSVRPASAFARVVGFAGPVISQRFERDNRRARVRRLGFAGVIAHPSRLRPELLWELGAPAAHAPGLPDGLIAITGYDTRERLSEIELPTLIAWGMKDHLVPVGAAYSYERRIPNSRLELFEDTGHMVQMERPGRFNRLLDEFLPIETD